jgi:4-alpha-glucanotransferase
MHWARASGILLHPTSLPGRYGIGDLGDAAYRWVDFLAASQQKLWQASKSCGKFSLSGRLAMLTHPMHAWLPLPAIPC